MSTARIVYVLRMRRKKEQTEHKDKLLLAVLQNVLKGSIARIMYVFLFLCRRQNVFMPAKKQKPARIMYVFLFLCRRQNVFLPAHKERYATKASAKHR